MGQLTVASLLCARAAGCGWLQLAWPVSLTVISGGKRHVAAAKNRIPDLLIGMGEELADRQGAFVASQAHSGCVLPQGLPGHSCARAGPGNA